jgi:hypothetical protein
MKMSTTNKPKVGLLYVLLSGLLMHAPHSLAMDKWEELIAGPVQMMLGLVINTNKLTVDIPDNYVHEVLLLLKNTWHPGRSQLMWLSGRLML